MRDRSLVIIGSVLIVLGAALVVGLIAVGNWTGTVNDTLRVAILVVNLLGAVALLAAGVFVLHRSSRSSHH